jgi:hypothetical protein
MISHRLSTLGNVDEIIVLKDGQIAERGTFRELKRAGGVFASLLQEQNRYDQEKVGDKSILRSTFVPLVAGDAYAPQPRPVPSPVTPRPPVAPGRAAGPAFQPTPGPAFQPAAVAAGRAPGFAPVLQAPAPAKQPPTARIIIEVNGKVVGQRMLDKPAMTIGRLSSNDIQVPSQRVSRLHAKIRSVNNAWIIEDAESLNGLIYQGQRIDHLSLTAGDRIFVAPGAVLQYQTA